jgi:lysophospholipase L1-like esterase
MRVRRALGSLGLALVASILSLAVAELVLGLTVPASNLRTTAGLNIYESDAELGYRLRPDVFRRVPWLGRDITIVTDRLGHRIPEGDPLARAGEAREGQAPGGAPVLVVAGDSYTFGNEVLAEETFVQLLGLAMNRRPVNLGVGGYSLDQSARMLGRYLTGAAPDLQALLVVYVGNDLEWGAAPRSPGVDLNGYLTRPSSSSSPDIVAELRMWVTIHSRLAFLAQKVWRSLTAERAAPVPTPGGPAPSRAEPTTQRWIYDPTRYTEESLVGHRAVLESLRTEALRAGVPVTVVLMPEPDQVHGALSDVPNRAMQELLAEIGLPVIDLLPLMRSAASTGHEPLYHPPPLGHLSPAGHRVVASLLAERVAGVPPRDSLGASGGLSP